MEQGPLEDGPWGTHQLVAACADGRWLAAASATFHLSDELNPHKLQAMLLACLSQVLVSGGLAAQQAAIRAGVLPLLLTQPCQDKAA